MSDEQIAATTEAPVTTEAPAAPPTMADTMDRVAREIEEREPSRGEGGKFQPKIAAEGANGTEVPGSPTAAQAPDPAPPVIEAPQSLPAEVKEKWSTFPPETQRWLADREGEVHKKFTADGERIKSLSAFEEVLKPFDARLKAIQAPPAEYVRRLAIADHELSTDFPNAVLKLCQMYGHDPRSVFGNTGQQPDPNRALDQRVTQQVESQVKPLRAELEQFKIKAAEEQIAQFSKDKPHFAAVEPLMSKMYEPGMDLNELYQMAVRAHPEVSAKVAAEAKAEADKKAAAEAKEKADKDARIGPLARKPGSTPTGPIKGKTIWETMDRVAAEVTSRT